MRSLSFIAVAVLGTARVAAANEVPDTHPPFVTKRIARLAEAPVTGPPARVLRYTFRGATVYYVPGPCCDLPSEIYDAAGNQHQCFPEAPAMDEDGTCADFYANRRDEALVWVDARKPR